VVTIRAVWEKTKKTRTTFTNPLLWVPLQGPIKLSYAVLIMEDLRIKKDTTAHLALLVTLQDLVMTAKLAEETARPDGIKRANNKRGTSRKKNENEVKITITIKE